MENPAPSAARPLAERVTPTLASAVAATVDEDTVAKRDAWVLARLRLGSAAFDDLVALFRGVEPALTDDERRQALNRSLSRLRLVKKAVRHVAGDAGRWELVA